MAKKSLLERTNSWKPFIDEIQGAVSAKDFRKSTVAAILHIVDPELSLWPGSLWHWLCGTMIGTGFPSGRTHLYTFPFKQFLARKGKVFDNAPLAAIQGYNALVSALFPQAAARCLLVDEQLARRRLSRVEAAIRKKESAQRATIAMGLEIGHELAAMEQPPSEASKPAAELAPATALSQISEAFHPLFSAFSEFDAAEQEMIERCIAASHRGDEETDEQQQQRERQVVSLLEQAVRTAKLQRQNSLIMLSSPQFFPFRDLLEAAADLPPFSLDEPFLMECFQAPEAAAAHIDRLLRAYNARCAPLIEQASRRTKAIIEIKKETERLQKLLEPFLQKKDLAQRAEVLLSQLSIIQIPETLFETTDSDEIATAISREQERLKKTSARIEEEFREFILQSRELTRTADFLKMMLVAARWEFISASTPYPDLFATVVKLRNQLLHTMEDACRTLLAGKTGLQDFTESLITSMYDVDIKVLRGELTARALRLKDLRNGMIPELLSMDRRLSLLALAGNTAEKTLLDREWISHLLFKLFSPYELFQDTYDPESINILFRYWWLDFERYLRGKQSRYYAFLHSIENNASALVRPIGRTLDCIEKVAGGKRLGLYQEFIDITKGKKGAEAASAIEKWLHSQEQGLLGALLPQLSLIPQVEQEPLIERILQLEERKKEVSSFAKALQAVKTFEPERIDSFLELFSVFPLIEPFDQPVAIRLDNQLSRIESALQRIEEELIAELGLLDRKARMESGYAISNLLPQTLLKVPSIIASLSGHLRSLAQHTDPYVSSIAHFLLDDTSALSQSFAAIGFDQEPLFTAFQKLAILLFYRKMLDNALRTKNFARPLLLTTATGQIVKRFRLMEAKGELPYVGTLIDELDACSSSQWDIIAPDLLVNEEASNTLRTFITIAQRIIATSGLTERREALLISGIEKVCRELSDNISYEIPRLSFVPGDLDYLWRLPEPSV